MKKLVSFLMAGIITFSAFSSVVIQAEGETETTSYTWNFDSAEGFSTTAGTKDIPVIADSTYYDSEIGAIKTYGGSGINISLSQPVTIGLDDKVTVEADIAYSKESGGKYMSYSLSSSNGTDDLLKSYLSAYSSTTDTTLKLGGIEKLTLNSSGAYGRPSSIYNPSSTADTTNGWTRYKTVYDYNAQLMTLTISSEKGTSEYTAPLSYETDISTLKLVSNNGSGRPCYVDNISITKEVSDVPYSPDEKVMSIIADATGDSTVVDTTTLYRDSHVTSYAVTTADADGNKVAETKVAADTTVTVDTTGAVKVEVVPVFRYENIGSLQSENTLKSDVENGLYNFTFKKSGAKRADIYVNGAMVANNVDKEGYNRTLSSGSEITVKDIVISDGSIRVSTTDTSDYNVSWCEFYRASTIAKRVPKVYVIGDSLVANYYGTASNQNKSQAGWGEVIGNYFTDAVEVVNLGNGGHYATILETTAFPGVIRNAQSGDYLIIESGYNDTKYNDADTTRESVERMVNAAKENGIIPVVVSPNASMQTCDGTAEYLPCTDDYVENVHYASAMKQAAENTNAYFVDLSKESYDYYQENYGDDRETVINNYYFPDEPDYLHHNYLGAMNCARIIAQGMYDSGITAFIDTDYEFTFTDTLSNEITYKVNTVAAPTAMPTIEPTVTPIVIPTILPTVAPTVMPTVEPTPDSDIQKGITATAEYENGVYKVTASAGELKGEMIVAAYKNGMLTAMNTAAYDGAEINVEISAEDVDVIKLMLWNSIEEMKPLCSVKNIEVTQTVPTATPTQTPIPTQAPTPQPLENEAEVVSLAGEWGLKLSSYSDGIVTDDTCILPGTLSENEKGSKNNSTDKTKLSLKYKYTGSAVYEKKVNIPDDWENKSVTLTLERTKNTKVWVNGTEQTDYNTNDSLAVPHEYYLTGLRSGEENTITVEVTNGEYDLFRVKTHMLTDETQTDWNGIIGEITLKATDSVYVKNVMVYPDITNNTAKVKAVIQKDIEEAVNGTVTLSANSYNHSGDVHEVMPVTENISLGAGTGETVVEYTYSMGDEVMLWSEFHPTLYYMTVSLDMENGDKNDYRTSFGMRDFSTADGQFTINGKATFLRGEANSAVFPLTGYPFMTKDEWRDFFAKAQSMGINFFRFHSWTPPMAAFEAADEMGIYMQPEMYGFGGTPTGFDTLYGKEGERILGYFASNPSFVMMALGNEMTTSDSATQAEIKAYREKLEEIDPTRLYAEGTNNNLSISAVNPADDFWTTAKVGMGGSDQQVRLSFAWNNSADGGRLEGEQPNSDQDFNAAMEYLNSDIPVMGHETGQYQVYPNFEKEIPKYESGVFAPRNLSRFQDTMESKGLIDKNEEFSRVTARTSAIQYRADIEAALKTSNFGGYQLLSIQDFPGQNTALVGILDSFMDDKDGGFTSEEYKSFNSPVTTLARIPKYMYNTTDAFTAEAVIANYSEDDINDVETEWSVKLDDGSILKEGTLSSVNALQGDVTSLGNINEENIFSSITKAQKLTFTVSAAGSSNSYSLWVYPVETKTATDDVLVADAYTKEVRDTLAAGGKVVMIPTPNETNLPNSVSVRWTNDYWSSMFHGRVAGAATTMGLSVDETHPVFADFPTEFFGDYQWYNLMKNSRAVILDDAPAELEVMAQNIDHMAYSRKLGSIFEAKVGEGKLLVCTMDVLNQMENYPEVRQIYNSLVSYAESDEFNPTVELTTDYLRTVFKQVINSTGEVSAYDIMNGFDYSWSQTKSELKSQSGTDENGNEITNAVGGISAGDMLRFDNVKFDGNGSTAIKITAANGADTAAVIEVYLGSDKGDMLTQIEFDTTGGWDEFVTQEYTIPHMWDTKNILIKFTNANICLGNITFVEDSESYRDPYKVIDPSNTSAGAVEFTSLGGSYETEQLTVKIIDGVRVTIPNCDFGFDGSSKVMIGGSIINDNTTLDVNVVYSVDGEEKKIPVTFTMGEGEEYTVMSGTTGEYIFWRNTIELGETISGVQDLSIEFPEGTLFEFSDITFVNSAIEAKVWDLTKAVTSKTTFDTIENRTFEYNGLTIVGGGASDYLDTSAGMHYNGKTSVTDGVANRYIAYMPKTDGTMKITAKRAYSKGALYVSESIDTSNGTAVENLSDNSSWAEGEVYMNAYTTYYFYCSGSGVEIKNMEFTPQK